MGEGSFKESQMSILREIKALYHIALSPIRGATHAERLESFYKGQADAYDQFRKHLLKGREEMYAALPLSPDSVMIEMGAGTGHNLTFLGNRVTTPRKIYLVDLSKSLLEVANQRITANSWKHVEACEADATTFTPPEGKVDVVTFSYSLTMIPDWFAAIDHAYSLLKPGGVIGVVDFYVARKYPEGSNKKHGWFTRSFWPVWFNMDNVYPTADHMPYLRRKFETLHFEECKAWMRYLPGLRVPYYIFIGRKRES
jgi:S-adenosylmethionine-diacylgycerolhomoserine-N-methlytransferase